jgi:predicted phage terminase large subunit-like protein
MNQKILLPEDQFISELCRDSFEEFVKEMWGEIIAEDLIWNWHMSTMCSELEYVAKRLFAGKKKQHDLIINVPPGSSKSTICSIMFPAWTWLNDPSMRHICGSHTFDLTLDLSRKTRQLLESEKWRRLFPEVKVDPDQNTKEYFSTEGKGWRKSVTVGGKSPTGFHAHFLIVDDPLDPEQAVSGPLLDKANRWMTSTLPSRKVDKTLSVTILIMQRLHQNDPTGQWLTREADRNKVRWVCLPADCKEFEVHPKSLRRHYVKGLLDPTRIPKDVLDENRKTMGEYGYAGQFGQHPIPKSGGSFKWERLHTDIPPPLRTFKKIVRFWDTASTNDGGDYTVGCQMGVDAEDRIWVLDIVRGQWETDQRCAVLKRTSITDGSHQKIGIEQQPGSAGKDAMKATIRLLSGFVVIPGKTTGDKTTRAEPFASQVNGSNVWLAKAHWNNDYIEEMKFFPNGTYDDQIDASSGAFNMIYEPTKRVGALT